ncbi:MAG: arsenate reductase (glutaredoxin) [Bradymonadaceae bacterium]
MIQNVTIWHNPRCSKSRQTLALLEERGIEFEVRRYLDDPPDAQTLSKVLDAMAMEPRDLMRRKEDEYRKFGLENPEMTRGELIAAMAEHPRLIERPVVIAGQRAALGRPPENVLTLFDD